MDEQDSCLNCTEIDSEPSLAAILHSDDVRKRIEVPERVGGLGLCGAGHCVRLPAPDRKSEFALTVPVCALIHVNADSPASSYKLPANKCLET